MWGRSQIISPVDGNASLSLRALPSCFLCRPSGDGGPYDVFPSLPGNGQLGSRRLEAPCLELWLGLLVSAYHRLNLLFPHHPSLERPPLAKGLPCILCSLITLHPSSLLVTQRAGPAGCIHALPTFPGGVEWIPLALLLRMWSRVSADEAVTWASSPEMSDALGKQD